MTVESIEYQGYGVAKPRGLVLFVEDALPGEVVDVRVYRWKRSFGYARVTEYKRLSSKRIEPFCAHFSECGGCKWQYLPYERQLEHKEQFVREIFDRLCKTDTPAPQPILGCEHDRWYRNKLDFSFSNKRWLTRDEVESGDVFEARNAAGFHVRGSFDKVLDIRECHLQPAPSNELRNAVADFARERGLSFYDPVEHHGLLRSLVVRTAETGEVMVIVVYGEEDEEAGGALRDFLIRSFPAITSLYETINTKRNDSLADCKMRLAWGAPVIREQVGELILSLGPQSFFQTNTRQAVRLYSLVREWAADGASNTVYDVYCGIGSIALSLAGIAEHVVGVESVPEAVDAAEANARDNGVKNCRFVAGTAEEVLRDGAANGASGTRLGDLQPDLVVLDPPRAGLHPQVVRTLLEARIPRILYISCKPSTQARDIERLSEAYRVIRMKPVDMFPQTHHIENVAELELGAYEAREER